MRSKPPVKKDERRALTRTAILSTYGITDRTLRHLSSDNVRLLTLEGVAEHGRVLYPLDASADFTLRLARNCVWSFTPFRPPFLRFLLLGFLTLDDEEILQTLADRGLALRTLTQVRLAAMRKRFVEQLPPPLKALAEERCGPETPVQEEAYRRLLRLLGLGAAYEHPEVLEQFYLADEASRHFTHQVLWTHSSTMEQKAQVLSETGTLAACEPPLLTLYHWLFHDQEFMRPEDQQLYYLGLAPKCRAAYREAATMSTHDFLVCTNLKRSQAAEYEMMSQQMRQGIRRLLSVGTPEACLSAAKLLTSAVRIDDHLGKIQPAGEKESREVFTEITAATYRFDDMFQLTAQPATDVDAG